MVKFGFDKPTKPKVFINIGALLDIPTGVVVTGIKGETIINGGLGQITALIGRGNVFKSTIAHYMMLSAADKVATSSETEMLTYDTEMNISAERLNMLGSKFEHLPPNLVYQPEKNGWTVVDKGSYSANDWLIELNKYVEEKSKDKKSVVKTECFLDPYTKQPLEMIVPTFVEIDSLSEFEPESTIDMLSGDLDSSDTNTFAMKQGLFKTKFFTALPRLAATSSMYALMTAHIGRKIDMATGPAKFTPPTKDLQFLKADEKIKGVSTKFNFLLNNGWYLHTPSLLINQSTKKAEYPKGHSDEQTTDLNIVRLTQLRGKNGPSGYTIELVVSQTEGVLPSLSEFHFIKENNRYGLEGSLTNYHLDLLPDVNLSRTTVRSKLDTDSRLRRAVNITAEMLQLEIFHPFITTEELKCTPKELYEDIKKLGYDWNQILDTRGYWLIDQYSNPVPFLSTVDLLKMRKGRYKPYFIKDKGKANEK